MSKAQPWVLLKEEHSSCSPEPWGWATSDCGPKNKIKVYLAVPHELSNERTEILAYYKLATTKSRAGQTWIILPL